MKTATATQRRKAEAGAACPCHLHNATVPYVKIEQRNCFGVAWYATEPQALDAADAAIAHGHTVNGGWYHGEPACRAPWFDFETEAGGKLYAVRY